jgi:hypothetical protein
MSFNPALRDILFPELFTHHNPLVTAAATISSPALFFKSAYL